MSNNNIILVGAMGVGKSTIGRKIAKKLKKEFLDSDKEIEKKTGVDISTIFEYEGEEGFRAREEKIINHLCSSDNYVLATGGGAILSHKTRTLLAACGTVFYLKASVDTLSSRTKTDSSRPLLNSSNRKQVIKELLDTREELYKETANYVIDTNKHSITWAVNQILKIIETNIDNEKS